MRKPPDNEPNQTAVYICDLCVTQDEALEQTRKKLKEMKVMETDSITTVKIGDEVG